MYISSVQYTSFLTRAHDGDLQACSSIFGYKRIDEMTSTHFTRFPTFHVCPVANKRQWYHRGPVLSVCPSLP